MFAALLSRSPRSRIFPPLFSFLRVHSVQRDYPNILQAIQQNHTDIAKIYAQNAIRKQNEKLNLLRLASRIDAVSSRVQTAVTMRQVTGSMANVVRGMDGAMKSMDLEKVRNLLSTIFPSLEGRPALGFYMFPHGDVSSHS